MQKSNTLTWTIIEKREEAPLVTSLILKADGERPPFIAGQYLTVLLPGFLPAEGKSYSISSTPQDEYVVLTVKEMGSFSRALRAREVGTTLTTSLPYGFFYPEPDEVRDLAFIAGGIGITPCASIIEDLLIKGYEKSITLFYSNKTVADIVFHECLTALVEAHSNFNVYHFITQVPPRQDLGEVPRGLASGKLREEKPSDSSYHEGRVTADFITIHLKNPKETDFFLCGSIDFTKSLWKSLRDAQIPSPNIYTEGFF